MNSLNFKHTGRIIQISLLAVLINLTACSKKDDKNSAQNTIPPVVVSSSHTMALKYHPSIEAIGRLEANRHATLSSESAGIVKTLHFQSGQQAQKGSLLLELNHEIDGARLKEKEAQLKLAQQTLSRKKRLKKSHAISQADLDETKTNYELAKVETELLKATLTQKFIYAPFGGKLGMKKIEVGEYLNPGNPVVSLQSTNPMKVSFSIPEEYLPELKQQQKIEFTTDAYPNQIFYANIKAIDVESENNHMIAVEGHVKNTDQKLYPGLFVKLKVYLGQTENVLTVPKTAINYSLYGNSVYVLNCKDEKCQAKQQYVMLGNSIGDHIIIKSGLTKKDEVIVSGQLKVHNNTPIVVKNNTTLETRN